MVLRVQEKVAWCGGNVTKAEFSKSNNTSPVGEYVGPAIYVSPHLKYLRGRGNEGAAGLLLPEWQDRRIRPLHSLTGYIEVAFA